MTSTLPSELAPSVFRHVRDGTTLASISLVNGRSKAQVAQALANAKAREMPTRLLRWAVRNTIALAKSLDIRRPANRDAVSVVAEQHDAKSEHWSRHRNRWDTNFQLSEGPFGTHTDWKLDSFVRLESKDVLGSIKGLVYYDTRLRAVSTMSTVLSVGKHQAAVVLSPKTRRFKEIRLTDPELYSNSRSTYSNFESLLNAVVEAVEAHGYSRDFAGDRVYGTYAQFYSAMSLF